jgi:hypothetical protein
MLSYPQLKSPINFISQNKKKLPPPEFPHANQDWIPDCVFFFFESNLFEETNRD